MEIHDSFLTPLSLDLLLQHLEEFFIDWENAGLSTVKKDGSRSTSKGDLAIKLTAFVEAGSNTGYLAIVKRRIDMVEKYV